MTQTELIHAFYVTGYENLVSWGRAGAQEQAKSGMYGNLVRCLVKPEQFANFPWILAENEMNALGVIFIDALSDLIEGRSVTSYYPVPYTNFPRAMFVEMVDEC